MLTPSEKTLIAATRTTVFDQTENRNIYRGAFLSYRVDTGEQCSEEDLDPAPIGIAIAKDDWQYLAPIEVMRSP